MFKNIFTAIRILTVVPVPGRDSENISSALPFFPFVGFLIGLLLYDFSILFAKLFNIETYEITAFFIIFIGTVLTGALHVDGFADWADSLGKFPDKNKMLAVMKDSHAGVFAVTAVVLLLLGKWIFIVFLLKSGMFVRIINIYIVSRFVIVDLSVWLPYARENEGTGKSIIENAGKKHFIYGFLSGVIILYVVSGFSGIIFLVSGWAVARVFGLFCKKYYGGITGDLLGASVEIVELSLLFFAIIYGQYHTTF